MTGHVPDVGHIGNRRHTPCHRHPASSPSRYRRTRLAGRPHVRLPAWWPRCPSTRPEVAELVVRGLADEWVATLIAEHRRETRTAQVWGAVTCGAPRRYAPGIVAKARHLLPGHQLRVSDPWSAEIAKHRRGPEQTYISRRPLGHGLAVPRSAHASWQAHRDLVASDYWTSWWVPPAQLSLSG